MFLFIVRHGECLGNLDADLGPDTPLTPLGEAQADRVGERLIRLPNGAITNCCRR